MSKFNRLFTFNVNTIALFCQKPGNGKICFFKNKPFIFIKESVRYQNTVASPIREKNKKKPLGFGSLFLLLIPLGTCGLGTWQVRRLKWKKELIENLNVKTSAPPIEINGPIDVSELENLEYRKVVVKGTFDHSTELFFGPRLCVVNGLEPEGNIGKGSYGYHVITPFILSDSGQRILVNRGWVKTKIKSQKKRPESLVSGEQTIVGVVRHAEKQGPFTPKFDRYFHIWYYRDIDEMAQFAHTLPVLLDATEESSIPGVITAGQTQIQVHNNHLSYIVTWYSLSIVTAIMWYKRFIH